MKVRIVVEDPKKGHLEIPLNRSEIRALGDLGFMFEDDLWKTLKLNKVEKPVRSAMRKFQFLSFDVLDDGTSYRVEKTPEGKVKLRLAGHRYIVQKPRWQGGTTREGKR